MRRGSPGPSPRPAPPSMSTPPSTDALDPVEPPGGTPLAGDTMERGPVSAFDRVQDRSSGEPSRFPWRALALFVVVVAASVAAYVLLRPGAPSESDLLGRLVEAEGRFEPAFASVDPEQAEAYVMDQFGWPVAAPDLPGLVLVAVGEADLGAGIYVPAFRYDGPDGATALVFAYDYVLLDRARGDLAMPEGVYGLLAEPEPVDTRRLGGALLVTWRRRATIYTAVTRDEGTFEQVGQSVRAAD